MSFKSGLSKLHSAVSEMYWNAVDNCPELMGVEPTEKQQKKEEIVVEAKESPTEVRYDPPQAVPQIPQASAVYVVMPPQTAQTTVQALIPEGYRLISDKDFEELTRYKEMYFSAKETEKSACGKE